eukprot:scaffold27107_cov79-Isochrysis_galbana.AAC.1
MRQRHGPKIAPSPKRAPSLKIVPSPNRAPEPLMQAQPRPGARRVPGGAKQRKVSHRRIPLFSQSPRASSPRSRAPARPRLAASVPRPKPGIAPRRLGAARRQRQRRPHRAQARDSRNSPQRPAPR